MRQMMICFLLCLVTICGVFQEVSPNSQDKNDILRRNGDSLVQSSEVEDKKNLNCQECTGLTKEDDLQQHAAPKAGSRSVESEGLTSQKEGKRRSRRAPEPLTFVQISDIHLDGDYKEGTATSCLEPICCRAWILGQGSAGKFGDYKCDAPEVTVSAMLDYITQTLQPVPEFFVYVGDSSPHIFIDTLRNKLEDNLQVDDILIDKLRNIGPIYPAIGNHETFPQSIYFRPTLNAQAVLQSVENKWAEMFDATQDQLDTIRRNAYYTALVKTGLRIVVTNSLYEYRFNIYSYISFLDPVKKEQQNFVRQTLLDARGNGEKVIFVSHIKPSLSETLPSYTTTHDELMTEFSDVIILQLFGHEHVDVFLLNRDPADRSRTTGASLAAPCMTPWRNINPSFRVFKLDPDTFQALDYDQYYIDLPESNRLGTVQVQKHYTFTEEYNVPDMSPASFQTISDRIHTEWSEFQKFETNYRVLVPPEDPCSENDVKCRRKLSCQTRESTQLRYNMCVAGTL